MPLRFPGANGSKWLIGTIEADGSVEEVPMPPPFAPPIPSPLSSPIETEVSERLNTKKVTKYHQIIKLITY